MSMTQGGRRSGARSTQAGLNAAITEPTIILLDVDLMLRGDPAERGADLLTSLGDLFAGRAA